MKKMLTLLLAAVSLSAASAQTVINGVVISRPGERPAQTQIRVVPRVPVTRVPVTPVTRATVTTTPTTIPVTGNATRTVPAFVDSAVPADWVDIRGRVSLGAERVRLPAGAKVSVRLLDITRNQTTLITADFATSHLPASYQLVSSPRRFTATGRYAVQAVVTSSGGETLYRSRLYAINPTSKRILADLQVR